MGAQPRPRPAAGASRPDLKHLITLYRHLPHPSVRWQTIPGGQFLDLLFVCVEFHGPQAVAHAQKSSTQGLQYMLTRLRPRHPRPWPAPQDLRDLHVAWRAVRAAHLAGTVVRRTSPGYTPIHEALTELLTRNFTVLDVALAMGVPARQLARFTQPPLGSPAAIARAIESLLPTHRACTPDWRD